MIGETISHYRIIEKIGEGGMGVVYLAEDTLLGRRVAIKTLTEGGIREPHFRSRFLREAQAVSKLSHPNIATVYDYGENQAGQPYIVMELVEGKTLTDVMRAEQLTIARAVEIVKQVADALSEAHRHGIVHRDIKPSNIALNERGVVKVLDFGLAKHVAPSSTVDSESAHSAAVHTQTREGVIVGTPLYLSPEQALGLEVDARSDLFSLGSVLYECTAGRPAFDGKSDIDICAKVIRDDPPPPSEFNNNVPPELDLITLKTLAKQPEMRFQTAVEMNAALETASAALARHISHQSVTRQSTPGSLARSTSAVATLSDIFRRPRLSIGYLAAATAFLLLIAFVGYRLTRARAHTPPAEAQKWFDVGMNYLREGAYFRAIKPLEQAVSLDPQFALARARLAEAWSELDYTDRAQQELLRVDGLIPDRSALPRLDGLYLDAIRSTITRDLDSGIRDYEAIQKLRPSDPEAKVDLAHAYEKNEEIDHAIANYENAVSLDAQHAAASLHLGVLYDRKSDLTHANAAFDAAESLFQTLGDPEGRAEVLFQRGILLLGISDFPAAYEQLDKSLQISKTHDNFYQQIRAMLRLSSVLYLRGTTDQAKQMASDAVNLAQSNGIENLAAQGLIDLGNTYLFRREYGLAEQVLKQALDIARRNGGLRNEALALLSLGNLYIQQEIKTDEALDYLQSALAFFERGGYSKELSKTILFRGRGKLLKGDYDGALTDFQHSLAPTKRVNDRLQLANTYVLMGNVLRDRERYPEALDNFNESYKLYKEVNNPISLAYLIVDRGQMLWRLGRDPEAEKTIAELPEVTNQIDSNYRQVLLARGALVRAEMAASQEQYSIAKSEGEQSITLAGKSPNHTEIEVKCVLASVLIRSGAKKDGLRFSNDAVTLANKINDPHLVSEAMLAQAEALLENGDADQALSIALQLQQRLAQAAQQESEWRAWLIAARANQQLKNDALAREQSAHARKVLADLEQKWGVEAFRGYAARKDVHKLRQQLEESGAGG